MTSAPSYVIAATLIHTTTVLRDQQASTDPWGSKATPDFQPFVVDLPCRYWVQAGSEQSDAAAQVVVEDMRLIVALGTDVTEKDQLGDIVYRGDTIVSGPIGIRAVLAHHDHLELVLVRIS